jgi:hypothetical protein
VEELLARGLARVEREAVERRVLARVLAERLNREAREHGAPSAAEVEQAAERVWPRLNDGPLVSVVHALFPTAPNADARASAFAASLDAKPTVEAFEATARAAGPDVVIERIDAIGNRGRTATGVTLERAFADAAVRLTMDSPRSDVVHTSYGTHVLLVTRRLEPAPLDASSRKNALIEEAIALRARDRTDAIVMNAAVRVENNAPATLKFLRKNP